MPSLGELGRITLGDIGQEDALDGEVGEPRRRRSDAVPGGAGQDHVGGHRSVWRWRQGQRTQTGGSEGVLEVWTGV